MPPLFYQFPQWNTVYSLVFLILRRPLNLCVRATLKLRGEEAKDECIYVSTINYQLIPRLTSGLTTKCHKPDI